MTKEEVTKTFYTSLILGITMIIFGIFILFKPESTIIGISHTLSVIIGLIGLSGFLRYFKRENKKSRIDYNLIYGIVSIVVSLILWFKDTAISSLIPFVLGIFMIVNTSLKVGYVKDLKSINNEMYKPVLLMLTFLYLFSIVLLLNLLKNALLLVQAIGMMAIIYSIVDINLGYLLVTIYKKVGNK